MIAFTSASGSLHLYYFLDGVLMHEYSFFPSEVFRREHSYQETFEGAMRFWNVKDKDLFWDDR